MKKVTKDKTLLGEAMTRKFFKIAALGPLAENFFNKQQMMEEEEPEDLDDAPPPPMEDEAPVPKMEPEAGMSGMGEDDVKKLVDAIAKTIEQVSGVEIGVEGHEATESPEQEDAEHLDSTPLEDNQIEVESDELDEAATCEEGEEKPLEEETQKSAKLKPLKMPVKLGEKKLSISKEKIAEISRNVVERLIKESKKSSKK